MKLKRRRKDEKNCTRKKMSMKLLFNSSNLYANFRRWTTFKSKQSRHDSLPVRCFFFYSCFCNTMVMSLHVVCLLESMISSDFTWKCMLMNSGALGSITYTLTGTVTKHIQGNEEKISYSHSVFYMNNNNKTHHQHLKIVVKCVFVFRVGCNMRSLIVKCVILAFQIAATTYNRTY